MKQKLILILSLIIEAVCILLACRIHYEVAIFIDELCLSGDQPAFMCGWVLLFLLAVLFIMTFVKLILSFIKKSTSQSN